MSHVNLPSWRQAAPGFLLLALLLATGPVAKAQATPTSVMPLVGTDPLVTAYTGPRFPGGPDSLRAALRRLLRPASPALTGQLFLALLLNQERRSRRPYLLSPPTDSPANALFYNKEAEALARQVVRQLPSWQPGPGEPGRVGPAATGAIIPLTFGPEPPEMPFAYSDENPAFPAQILQDNGLSQRGLSLTEFLKTQLHYPVAALQQGKQGTVYGYFEVSETGAIEQRRIVGSADATLDAEVLRVLHLIPHALTPPRLQGRPVRVYYVQPYTFKIK